MANDLRRFDLNLLVAFEALMEERSVTGAARRLGVGQPAMSSTLARLRDMFGDPLLSRGAQGMIPTQRALALMEPIGQVLADMREQVFAILPFEPAAERRSFRVGVSDQAEVAIMPGVLNLMRQEAPEVSLIARSVEMRLAAEMLQTGAIDLALGYFPDVDAEIETQVLYHETFVCLFDAEACGLKPPLSLDDYVSRPHVLASLRGEPFGHIDERLQETGRSRKVVYTTPHFLALPFILLGMRAIAAVPRRLAQHCADAARLDVSPLPLGTIGYDVRMAWHRRSRGDAGQRWMREIILRAVERNERRIEADDKRYQNKRFD